MKTFYVFLTVLSDALKGALLSACLDEGMKVGPLGRGGGSQWDGEASTLLGLKIEVDNGYESLKAVKDPAAMNDKMREVLDKVGMVYHSLIVHEMGGSFSWVGSNIKMPKKTRFEKVDGGEKKPDDEIEFERKQP